MRRRFLYLREKGLSDAVMTAMLSQRKTEMTPPQPAPTAQPSVWANSSPPRCPRGHAADLCSTGSGLYIAAGTGLRVSGNQLRLLFLAVSSAYWGFPALSFSFGWGGRYGGYHGGGFRGGGHFGGGFHGGGHR